MFSGNSDTHLYGSHRNGYTWCKEQRTSPQKICQAASVIDHENRETGKGFCRLEVLNDFLTDFFSAYVCKRVHYYLLIVAVCLTSLANPSLVTSICPCSYILKACLLVEECIFLRNFKNTLRHSLC